MGRRVRVPKTAELVASQLRRRIIRGELTEGDALPPEPTLMTQFGVSRPTLREAFRVLEAEALISVRRGAHGGARVHLPSPTVAARYAGLVLEHRGATLGDVHQASAIIEPPCAALLAERHDAVDVSVLRGILAEADEVVDDPTALAAAQAAFHLAVVELTGNKSLSVVTGMLQHLVELTNAQHGHALAAAGPDASPAATAIDRAVDNRLSAGATRQIHAALVDLVEIGDAAGADRHWRQHLAAPDHAIPGGPADRCVLDLLG
ncbi:FadR/GntR family transcriptional regulator [Frankia gtarii]|uniref:FadR/GntR family transcriptional regulator n=2 Tax=Frankia gtarii TaxID=2950102 RepID=UPI0021BECD25|nr:GntR family transcriptional regulator [Frankia gtarii]